MLTHVAYPRDRWLFAGDVQSGAFLTQTPLQEARRRAKASPSSRLCSQTAACLRGLRYVITRHDRRAFDRIPGGVDGEVLKQSIGTALASGQFNRVPIINGTTHDEGRLLTAFSELQGAPVTAANYQAMIASTVGVSAAVAAVVAKQYPLSAYPSPAVALSAVGTDAAFACPALKLDKWASEFVPTFAYEFNDANAPQRYLPPVSFPYGAAHASEIPYLFDLPTAPIAGTLSAQQQQLAASMRRDWAAFAASGRHPRQVSRGGRASTATASGMLSLRPPQPQVQTDCAAGTHCAFWATARIAQLRYPVGTGHPGRCCLLGIANQFCGRGRIGKAGDVC